MYCPFHVCMHAPLLQSCTTLWNPMDCSLPGSSVHGILQARILEWVAMPSCRGSSLPRDQTHLTFVSCIAGGFFTHWVTCKTLPLPYTMLISVPLCLGESSFLQIYILMWVFYPKDYRSRDNLKESVSSSSPSVSSLSGSNSFPVIITSV